MLNSEELEKLRKAGRIAANARELGMSMVKEGVKYYDVAEEVEGYIKSHGCKLAFPCNISVNHYAAHYTPSYNDRNVFEIGDVVKVDCGAHVDGFVGDTAGTVEVGTKNFKTLIESAKAARDAAMEIIGEGCPLNKIGEAVNYQIASRGFSPIRNLSGHQIEPYNLHAGLCIPNYDDGDEQKITAGIVLACEPFATNGEGIIVGKKFGNIYKLHNEKELAEQRHSPIRDPRLRDYYNYLMEEFSTFPFCARHCEDPKVATVNLTKLMHLGYLTAYAICEERKGGCVSQFEHTVYIGGKKGEITTNCDGGY